MTREKNRVWQWKDQKRPEFDNESGSSASMRKVWLTSIMSLENQTDGITSCSNSVEEGGKLRRNIQNALIVNTAASELEFHI